MAVVALAVVLAFAALAAFAVANLASHRRDGDRDVERERPIKPPSRAAAGRGGEMVVTLSDEERQRGGLKTARLAAAPRERHLRAYGTVLDLAGLNALNNAYSAAVSQQQIAEARLGASEPAFARAESLRKDGAASQMQLQTAEAAFRADTASAAAARAQVRAVAATAVQEWGQVIGKALVDGDPLTARLIERREFLLQITLAPGMSEPPSAAMVRAGGSADRIEARRISIAARADPKIQGLSYFYLAPASGALLPGMSVLAELNSPAEADAFVIPESAVVWQAGRPWLYLCMGAGAYARREIPAGLPREADGGVIMPPGVLLTRDSEIVTRGAQMLLSEEFRAQIQVGEDPNQ